MPVQLPAVRDRSRDDRLALIMRIFNDLRTELPDGPTEVGAESLERLLGYGWPGNVREMRNVLERALILGRGQAAVGVEHLPGEFRARPGPGDRRHTPLALEELVRQHVERTLRHHGGNRTRSALELGISRATLINKIKRWNLDI
jgi:transcriptional regulator with PAS, ATPase and Fis domain